MRIKGETTIELRDAKTGKVKKTVHSNTIQTAVIQKLLYTAGMGGLWDTGRIKYNDADGWKHIVGGILCFDTAQTVGDEYMKPGSTMIAHGAYGKTNGSTPNTFGSYNSVESVIGRDSISLVYDFNTSQANGTIASICLCPAIGGAIGYGEPDETSANLITGLATNVSCESDMHYVTLCNYSSTMPNGSILTDGEYMWWIHGKTIGATSTLTLREAYTGFKKYDICKNWANALSTYDEYTITLNASDTAGYGSAQASYNYMYNCGQDKLALVVSSEAYIYQASASGTPKTVDVYIVDCKTHSVSRKKTITNRTGVGQSYSELMGFLDDTLCIQSNPNNGTLYVIDIDTDTIVDTFTTYGYGGPASNTRCYKLRNKLYLLFGIYNANTRRIYVYDAEAHTLLPADINTGNKETGDVYYYSITSLGVIVYAYKFSTYYNRVMGYHNPLMLTTVNNLDTPVTKTVNDEMKITYTLTRVEE